MFSRLRAGPNRVVRACADSFVNFASELHVCAVCAKFVQCVQMHGVRGHVCVCVCVRACVRVCVDVDV